MVLVKPATVVQWHRQGLRLYWRWRSRSGGPSIDREIRDLIRQMNKAKIVGPVQTTFHPPDDVVKTRNPASVVILWW